MTAHQSPPRRLGKPLAMHRTPQAAPRSQKSEITRDTLLLATSIAFRFASEPDAVYFADITGVDRGADVVLLRPWGWRRRVLAVPFDRVLSASPSSSTSYEKERAIRAAQRVHEADPLWGTK